MSEEKNGGAVISSADPEVNGRVLPPDEAAAIAKAEGQPLPDHVRTQLEQQFDQDFSDVRVHTGPNAFRLTRAIGAQAFAFGSHIFLNSEHYAPNTSAGKHLLAHELTHTMQQSGPNVQED